MCNENKSVHTYLGHLLHSGSLAAVRNCVDVGRNLIPSPNHSHSTTLRSLAQHLALKVQCQDTLPLNLSHCTKQHKYGISHV